MQHSSMALALAAAKPVNPKLVRKVARRLDVPGNTKPRSKAGQALIDLARRRAAEV